MNLVYEIFVAVSSATTHCRCLQIWHILLFGMPYGRNNFCANGMPTSCISVGLSEECIWNIVYGKFSLQFSQQLLVTDAWNFNTLFLLAYHMMGSFLHESDVNFLFVCIWNFRRSFLSNHSAQVLEILAYRTFLFTIPHGGNHFCMNSMSTSCLFFYLSIYKAY